jgi:hypothetical protein
MTDFLNDLKTIEAILRTTQEINNTDCHIYPFRINKITKHIINHLYDEDLCVKTISLQCKELNNHCMR